MHQLVLLVTVASLLGCGCRSANVNRHMKLLPDLNNSIEPNIVSSKQPRDRKFVSITQRPLAAYPHAPGTTVELTCEAIGAPAPTVHWYKNDAPVYEHELESNEIFDSNPTSLGRVTSTLLVSRTDDQDEYTCLVRAGMKNARASTTVFRTEGSSDLSERARLLPLSPRIVVSYKVFMDTIGNNVVLPCRAKGHPRPHVVWRDNKGAIVRKDPRMKVLRSGELVITSLRWGDMGEFTCHAVNAFGSHNITTFVYPTKAG